jgi:hypothetical protein
LISGDFENTIYFGADSLISGGESNVFLAKYDPNLNLLQLNQLQGSSADRADAMLINSENSVYLTGTFRDTLRNADLTIATENGKTDMFIAKFDADGAAKGLRQSGGQKADYGNILINDRENYLYLMGNFSYNFAFETDSVSTDSVFNAHADDIFFAKFFDCSQAQRLNIGQDTAFCGSGTLQGQPGFKKYLWNTGQKRSQITVSESGNYQLTAVDSHKCPVASNIADITVNPAPNVNLGSDIYTGGGQTFELCGGDFTHYLWNTGDTTRTITVNTDHLTVGNNTFKLTATNSFDCKSDDQINIILDTPHYSAGNPNAGQNTGSQQNSGGLGKSNGGNEMKEMNVMNGMKGMNLMKEGTVYPNPNDGNFTVKTGGLFDRQNVEITITDEAGQTVYEKSNIIENTINITLKTAGVYTLRVKGGGRVYAEKVVVE